LTADLKRKRSLSFYPQSPHMALLWIEALWERVQSPQAQIRPLTTNSKEQKSEDLYAQVAEAPSIIQMELPSHPNIQ
jgi:hypothetical protein